MYAMGVWSYYLVIILSFSVVYCENYGSCANPFRDMKNNIIEIKDHCKGKHCVVKCCKENELFSTKGNTYKCVDKSKLISNVVYNSFTVYKDDYGKIKKTIKTIDNPDFTFIQNVRLDQENCVGQTVSSDSFHIFENASLIFEYPNGTIAKQVEMKDYCMDYVFNETVAGFQNLKFTFKLLQCMDNCVDVEKQLPINVEEYCKGTRCIAKCCRSKSRIFFQSLDGKTTCQEISKIKKIANGTLNIDFKAIDIYKSDVKALGLKKSTKNLEDDFKIIMNKKLSKGVCADELFFHRLYILENSSLILELPNYYKRFLRHWDLGNFCFDYFAKQTKSGVQRPVVAFKIPKEKSEANDGREEVFKSVALLISCFFLLLVLFVYGVIKELRNLVGMVLMAFIATFFVAFLIRVIEFLGVLKGTIISTDCKYLTVVLYYATLSSFFWMNIMSLDIWWTFRGMFKSRPIHRRGEMVKFAWYGLYAWGLPLLITIAVTTIDFMDLSHRPDIYKPHFETCLYINADKVEMKNYLYMPILGLLVVDWIFFLMTSFNIWRIRRCMSQFANEASKYNNNQNRFGLYLKLSLVMGISWVLEVLPIPRWLEIPADIYNGLIGVSIFFIFVFKRKIFFKLCKRLNIQNKFIDKMQRNYSKYTSSAGNEENTQEKKEESIN